MMLQALQDHPSVRQWFVSAVGMHDLSDGDPAVLHSMDDTIKTVLFSQRVGSHFNNQDAYTDAQVMSSDPCAQAHRGRGLPLPGHSLIANMECWKSASDAGRLSCHSHTVPQILLH